MSSCERGFLVFPSTKMKNRTKSGIEAGFIPLINDIYSLMNRRSHPPSQQIFIFYVKARFSKAFCLHRSTDFVLKIIAVITQAKVFQTL